MGRPRSVVKSVRVVSYIHPSILSDYEREAAKREISVSSLVASTLVLHSSSFRHRHKGIS